MKPCRAWNETVIAHSEAPDVWELFHENSKSARYSGGLSHGEVLQQMQEMACSLNYAQYPSIELPEIRTPMMRSFGEVLETRESARQLEPRSLTLENLATLLYAAYGVTRDNLDEQLFPRPFRIVPSAGALYPLEIYFHTVHVEEIEPGLYHYDPSENRIVLLQEGDYSRQISQGLVQPEIPTQCSLLLFITSMFERVVFKYGDRGYRFALLEAGHVAQNLNLCANALDLRTLNIGGYFDRVIDRFLGLDGLMHSTIYLTAVGGAPDEADASYGF